MTQNKPIVRLSRDDWELLFAPTKTPIVNASMTFWETPNGLIVSEEPVNLMASIPWYSAYQVSDDALIFVYDTYDFDLLSSDTGAVLNRNTFYGYGVAEIIAEAQDHAQGRCEEIIVREINGALEDFIVEAPEDCEGEE